MNPAYGTRYVAPPPVATNEPPYTPRRRTPPARAARAAGLTGAALWLVKVMVNVRGVVPSPTDISLGVIDGGRRRRPCRRRRTRKRRIADNGAPGVENKRRHANMRSVQGQNEGAFHTRCCRLALMKIAALLGATFVIAF